MQAHGGSRQGVGSQCSNCHTPDARDRTVGSAGKACTTDAQCSWFTAGYETCQDTNGDSAPDTCIMNVDPTPNQVIDFRVLLHEIHYARLRDGYSERNNLIAPGLLTVVGNSADTLRHRSVPAGHPQLQEVPRRRRRQLLGIQAVRHRPVVRRRHLRQHGVAAAVGARLHFLPR